MTARVLLALLLLSASHDSWDRLLRAHVTKGAVDYAALKKKEAELDAWLATLAKADETKMSRKERLAFWINAYNAFTLKLILEHYPNVRSIRDLEKPWKTKRWKAAGKVRSLDEIEHEVLLGDIGEPRVHFALVCAAKSCPPLRAGAWSAKEIDKQLDAAARAFLADRKYGFRRIEGEKPAVELSKIFEWYRKDFERSGNHLLKTLRRWLPEEDRRFLDRHRGKIEVRFLEYDWTLNSSR